ncbi:MAG: hypothetical protein GC162_02090 [Planctomycetes bacterium]|nr:hypothetical protein [Planctomycetota bacterium]
MVRLISKRAVLAATIVAMSAWPGGAAHADTVYFNDTFENIGGTATRDNDTAAGNTADIAWFTNGNFGTFTVVNAGGANGNMLEFSPGTSNVRIAGVFDADVSDNNPRAGTASDGDGNAVLPVGLGNRLELSMDFRFNAAIPNPRAWNFGLFEDTTAGGVVTADNLGHNALLGYYASLNTGTASAGSSVSEGTNSFGGGGSTTLGSAASGLISDTAIHTLKLVLENVATGINVQFYLDNALQTSGIDTTSPYRNFNTVAIQTTSSTNYRFDNVKLLQVIVVPAPAALPAGLGLLSLGMMHRRRRR